jgi:hypothetical protein
MRFYRDALVLFITFRVFDIKYISRVYFFDPFFIPDKK